MGTVEEFGGAPAVRTTAAGRVSTAALPIGQVDSRQATARSTGVGELDRVLGGGLVPGAVVLLAGEPGVGKSTLLLDVAAKAASEDHRTLYVTAEESASQVRLRADRIRAINDHLYLAAETDLSAVLGHLDAVKPSLLILDSVQTVASPEIDGAPGGMAQVREVAGALIRASKERGMSTLLVGHVTKDGAIAGPRLLEHLVDVVLSFEGDRHARLRLVRGVKNRYGATDEVGCFELHDEGITGLADPSGLFLTRRDEPVPGTCLTVTLEGKRPLVAEVQALTVDSQIPSPRRTTSGLETSRVSMMLAVLEQRGRISSLGKRDIYSATVGGVKLSEPAADLAVALALASAASDTPAEEPGGDRRSGPRGRSQKGHGGPAQAGRGVPPGLHARAGSYRPGEGPGRYEGHRSRQHGRRAESPPAPVSRTGPPGGGRTPVDFALVSPVRTNGTRDARAPQTCDRRSAVAANDRAASPGKSGQGTGNEALMRASLSAVAPGMALRDGLERILRGNTGGLIVLGMDKTVESMCTGGFVLDVEFTATRLRELAKLDGALILDKDMTKILRAGVQLVPDASIPTEETGTRHRTADRVSKQCNFPVVSVSQSMRLIALYVDGERRVLEESAAILSRANQALATLERYKLRLDEVAGTLSALEIEDLVTVRDVTAVAQRLEMVRRIATEIAEYVVELGTDGRLLSLQLDELIAGVEPERELVVRDYVPEPTAKRSRTVAEALTELDALSHTELLELPVVARALGYSGSPETLDSAVSPRGFRLLAKVPRLPGAIIDRLVEHFGGLQKLLAASVDDLQTVDGVGEARARSVREGLSRLAESSILERYV